MSPASLANPARPSSPHSPVLSLWELVLSSLGWATVVVATGAGAPMALEDHARRACLAALDIQKEVGIVAAGVKRLNDITLQLRIGLNSGQVIAGESAPALRVTQPSAIRSAWPNGWSLLRRRAR